MNGSRFAKGAVCASLAPSNSDVEKSDDVSRIPSLVGVAVALVALASPSLLSADDKVHEATFVKAGDGKITLTFKGDEKKHTHDVAKDAKITLDDKAAKLEDLKEGFTVKVTMDEKFVVSKIEAKTKDK